MNVIEHILISPQSSAEIAVTTDGKQGGIRKLNLDNELNSRIKKNMLKIPKVKRNREKYK